MITKIQIINAIEKMPENLTIDQVIDHLVFLEKVEKGMNDSREGRIYSQEAAKVKLGKWLK